MTDHHHVIMPVFALLFLILVVHVVETATSSEKFEPNIVYLFPEKSGQASVAFSSGERYSVSTDTGPGVIGEMDIRLYNLPPTLLPNTIISSGETIKPGESFTRGTAVATLGTDGNFVLYDGVVPLFSTNTSGATNTATLRSDGNFIVQNDAGDILWSSGTDFGKLPITTNSVYQLVLTPAVPGGQPNISILNQLGSPVWSALTDYSELS